MSAPKEEEEVTKVQRYLDSIYTRADVRHSFRTVFAEDVDCIDFEAQPSVKYLRQHGMPVITEAPHIDVARPSGSGMLGLLEKVALRGAPDENGNARSCPPGTVPHPRTTADQILRAGGLSAYLSDQARPRAPMPPPPRPGSPCPTRAPQNSPPFFNWVTNGQYISNQGGASVLGVYNPYVQQPNEHSLSELWTTTGCNIASSSIDGPPSNPVESVEVGWEVNPQVEGTVQSPDYGTHLFTYSTQDGYFATGCYNLQTNCATIASYYYGRAPASSGFVQWQNPPFYPGMTIINVPTTSSAQPVSPPPLPPQPVVAGVDPPELGVQTYNPGGSAAAWYIWVDGALIGYYPIGLFSGQMTSTAAETRVGGEIVDEQTGGQHTFTFMGSGDVPCPGYGYAHAAYHRSIQYINPCSQGSCYFAAQLAPEIDGSGPATPGAGADSADEFFGYSTAASNPAGPNVSGVSAPWNTWGNFFYFGGYANIYEPACVSQ